MNPAAESFELPPGWFDQGQLAAWGQLLLQQMSQSLRVRPPQVGGLAGNRGLQFPPLFKYGPAGGVSGVQPEGC